MTRRRGLASICVAVALAGLPTASAAAATTHEVTVKDTAFTPPDLQIEIGDTVQWRVLENGHTITFTDGSLDREVVAPEIVERTFTQAGRFTYFCRRHGSMKGAIQVGPRSVPGDEPSEVRVVPSLDFPTIESALANAPRNSLIALRPGIYDITQTIMIATPGVVLAGVDDDGSPADPGNVVLRGRRGTAAGIRITAKSNAFGPAGVRDLTVTAFVDTGIAIDGAENYVIERVVASRNLEAGLVISSSRGGALVGVHSSGHRRAGIAIQECENCDVQIRDAVLERNFVGLLGHNAGSVVLRDSVVRDNASGVVLRSVLTDEPRRQLGGHIYGNTITGNHARSNAPSPSLFSLSEAMELPIGAGVWIQGGWFDVVEANLISGSHYGIAITASPIPVWGGAVRENELTENSVDIGWDGAGVGVCFQENAAATTEPAEIEERYDCRSPDVAGVPHPKVTVDLALYAYRHYYCHEISEEACR